MDWRIVWKGIKWKYRTFRVSTTEKGSFMLEAVITERDMLFRLIESCIDEIKFNFTEMTIHLKLSFMIPTFMLKRQSINLFTKNSLYRSHTEYSCMILLLHSNKPKIIDCL